MSKRIQLVAGLLLSAVLLCGCGNNKQPPVDTGTQPPQQSGALGTTGITTPITEQTNEVTAPPKELFRKKEKIDKVVSNKLTVWAIWEAVSYDGKTADITVKVGISCWDFRTSKSSGTISLDREEKKYTSPPIEYRLEKVNNYLFNKDMPAFTVSLDPDAQSEFDLSVSWFYGDTPIELETVIQLPLNGETSEVTQKAASTPEGKSIPQTEEEGQP